MTAKVIDIFQHLVAQETEAIDAAERAMARPYHTPADWNSPPQRRQMAVWLVESLWLEGFRIVRASDEE